MATGELTTHSSLRLQVSNSLGESFEGAHLFNTGTTFHYERKYKNSKARGPLTLFAPESIRALGPTTEALFIVVSISISTIAINVNEHEKISRASTVGNKKLVGVVSRGESGC